ncbi:DDE-type integrase/transposase/recombinase [Pseudoalteromonas sp. SR41-4]|uniref:DDE-type integrase/transposase/recombinase n=1 Tax=Pseudoalteromonas sp. SR41-4 TaxID=2760950 RepID=UPI0015FF9DB7|nr:DDE-type integrase/transposase/recombinase [Pseudoalteromonas sp. SR41-4]MBB1293376.1 transposase [Pseudoalteromonas sp. SR41-4]
MSRLAFEEGMKIRIDESLYIIDALQKNSLSNSIYFSPLDDTKKKIPNSPVKVLSHSELTRKLINNEACVFDSNIHHPTVNLFLSNEQIKNQEMWCDFAEEHIKRHAKHLMSDANIDESRSLFNWDKYNSTHFSRSTCQAKVKAYIESNKNPRVLINYGAASRKGTTRFTEETEDVIFDYFTDYYFVRSDKTAKSVNKIADLIRCKIIELNKKEPERYPKTPSKASIYRRLNGLEAEMSINKTLSKQQQKHLRYELGREYIGVSPMERVEMDAVYINLGINNESGSYLGTLVAMFAIDTYSRCIVGYSIHVGVKASESEDLAIECVKNIMAPKENLNWICSGIPIKLITDATTAAIGSEYRAMLVNLGVMPITTVSNSPWQKPFIESFFRTLRREFLAQLPGYLGSKTRVNNSHLEQTETAKLHAVLTLQEFEVELQKFITETYHQSGHGGLNQRAPIDVWSSKVNENPLLICKPSPEYIPGSFRAWVSKNHTLYANGSIKLKNEKYVSPELKDLSLSGVEKVDCFYSDIDTSSIVVKVERQFFIVPIRPQNYHDGAGSQQAELDAARKSQFNECEPSVRKHYEYDTAKRTKMGLQDFKKAKAAQAEENELDTGKKAHKRKKYDNTKSIDISADNAHEKILNAVNCTLDSDVNSEIDIGDGDEFPIGEEL